MPTIERKSKFNKSKSIYKKRKKKNKIKFELYNFENYFVDGKKVKPLTKKIINNLIIQKSVVSIFGEYDLERVIIISQNENFLILIDFSEDFIFGQLGIIYLKFINNIELLKDPKSNLIKNNFNIYNLQSQYFNYIKLLRLPTEVIQKIKDYVNINNYLEFSKLGQKTNKELLLFLSNKINIPCSIYVKDIEPELYGKLYNISDNNLNIKSVDLNHIFYSDYINIDINNIEYISLNIFNNDKELEEYFNNDNNNFINDVLNKIDNNLKFINNIDNTFIKNNNEFFNIEYEEIKKIYYFYKNQHEIENFKKEYVYSKNIVDNIKEYNINYENYNLKNDYVDIILEDDETINNVIILENQKEYLILSSYDSNFKVFKKYIKKII